MPFSRVLEVESRYLAVALCPKNLTLIRASQSQPSLRSCHSHPAGGRTPGDASGLCSGGGTRAGAGASGLDGIGPVEGTLQTWQIFERPLVQFSPRKGSRLGNPKGGGGPESWIWMVLGFQKGGPWVEVQPEAFMIGEIYNVDLT